MTYDPDDAGPARRRGRGARPDAGRDDSHARRSWRWRGRPVVTPNKSSSCASTARRSSVALDNGVRLAYHNSIAAGLAAALLDRAPVGSEARRGDPGAAVEHLQRGAGGHRARRLAGGGARERRWSMGLSEPDPELDVSGWDTAQKLLILDRAELRPALRRRRNRGPGHHRPRLRPRPCHAPASVYRVKLVGLFVNVSPEPDPRRASGRRRSADGHLGGVHGDDNAVVLADRDAGEMVFVGKGTGPSSRGDRRARRPRRPVRPAAELDRPLPARRASAASPSSRASSPERARRGGRHRHAGRKGTVPLWTR